MEETLRMLEEELTEARSTLDLWSRDRMISKGHNDNGLLAIPLGKVLNALELTLQLLSMHRVEYGDLPMHGGDKHF